MMAVKREASEYERLTRGHPWERSRRQRGDLLRCRNCLLDLDLMGAPGRPVAARIMPSAATRILDCRPAPCRGVTPPEGTGYFLLDPEGRRMIPVEPRAFYRALRRVDSGID